MHNFILLRCCVSGPLSAPCISDYMTFSKQWYASVALVSISAMSYRCWL